MSSRDKILTAVKANQPSLSALPDINTPAVVTNDPVVHFMTVLHGLGGRAFEVTGTDEIIGTLKTIFPNVQRIVSVVPGFLAVADAHKNAGPHALEDVDVAILEAQFGVAENGAVWITDSMMVERVLPFISQHLVCIVDRNNIVADMHDAYDLIADADYSFGTFIAGPSKTADIEQSLVLGAHGAMTMTVFVVNSSVCKAL